MSRKDFYPIPALPLVRGGSKKFTNDLGLLYVRRFYHFGVTGIDVKISPIFTLPLLITLAKTPVCA